MKRFPALLTAAAIVLSCLAAALLMSHRLDAARARAHTAILTASAVEADAARLTRLRAAQPTIGDSSEPQADALRLVNAAIEEAGLSSTVLRSLTPASPSARSTVDTAGVTTSRLQLVLTSITLPDLGAFFHSWRTSQRIWTIERIELRPETRASRPTASQSEPDAPRWTATLGLRATYLQHLATPPRGAAP